MESFRWALANISKEDIAGKDVIEVGSYDVNGSLRCIIELMEPSQYLGVDIAEGPGVDEVCPAEKMADTYGKESFDVVISTCVLEHILDWKTAISNMKQICKTKGLIIFIVPSTWPFHEHPYDYWRYNKEDVVNIFSDCNILTLDDDQWNPRWKPTLVYAKIMKPDNFMEKDLSDYMLYSIIKRKKLKDIKDNESGIYLKWLYLKCKIREYCHDGINLLFQ